MSEQNTKAARILLVDDESNVLKAISRLLREHEVTALTSPEEALILALKTEFDLVISDFRMPGMNGVEFLTSLMRIQPETIRMILTGYADLESAQQAINEAGVYRFLNKPWNNIEITNAVQAGLQHKHMIEENTRLANQVREQQKQLDEKDLILKALEKEEPGITHVNWAEDGSIIIDEADYE